MTRKRGGLDYCEICGEPLALGERNNYWDNEGTCNECLTSIETTKSEIDENINSRKKK